jgi:ubiquinone/menaquinone biosynthesis C-methylase UbiE
MTTVPQDKQAVRELVKERYAKAAEGSGCCASSCCSGSTTQDYSQSLGYAPEDLAAVPEGADLGLGCGNPTALASLAPGEVVVDLGAGAGIDCFIAARAVGPEGRVIGIDMTPAMLERARKNAVDAGVSRWVEFREGIIEALPVVSSSVDVILSNCVINLSPDKKTVFREAFRVLKPGGRLAVSDILLSAPLPADIASLAAAYVSCIGGAILADEYFGAMREAGFVDIEHDRTPLGAMLEGLLADPTVGEIAAQIGAARVRSLADSVFSYKIRARKP